MMIGGAAARATAAAALVVTTLACSQSVTQLSAPTTTAGPSLSSQPPAECTVSNELVPTCGAWFGVSSPSADGRFDYTRGLAEYRELIDTPPDILHFYRRGATWFPDEEHIAMAEPAGEPRSLLYFSWKPDPQQSWREVAEGGADASIETVAESLSSYPHTMFLTIHHEPENDVVADAAAGMTTADYVAMYRYVVGKLRALGVDNVVYVMGYMGFERWSSIVDELYPGDDVVDWIAYDPYGFREHDTFEQVLNDPNDSGWPGFYEWAIGKAPGKPIMLAEWGFDLAGNDRAAELASQAPDVLPERFPMLKALVYWNDRGQIVDARITGDATYAGEFADSIDAVASHPYFNATSTNDAP